MENLVFDSGIKEYRINERGVLRFNPSDPNVYGRFLDAMGKIKNVEKQMTSKAQTLEAKKNDPETGAAIIRIMVEADQKMKKILNDIFGGENDFNEILEGVNLMAVARNGRRVVSNLIDALMPIMEEGAKSCAEGEVETAKLNREQRRALQ